MITHNSKDHNWWYRSSWNCNEIGCDSLCAPLSVATIQFLFKFFFNSNAHTWLYTSLIIFPKIYWNSISSSDALSMTGRCVSGHRAGALSFYWPKLLTNTLNSNEAPWLVAINASQHDGEKQRIIFNIFVSSFITFFCFVPAPDHRCCLWSFLLH